MPSCDATVPLPAVVFAIVVSALVGGLFGRSALAIDDKIPDHYKTFTAALSAIETNYVDKVESDRLVYSAIRGMLGTLDPHSSFFDPREYAQMRERQEGRYYGIGITIVAIDGDITAHERLRRIAGLQEGHSPRRHHLANRRRGREGLVDRSGDAQAARAEGHQRRHRDQAARLRAADSDRR